jgi:hypothetical protein
MLKKYFPFITSSFIILLGLKAYSEGKTTFGAIALVFGTVGLAYKLYMFFRNKSN